MDVPNLDDEIEALHFTTSASLADYDGHWAQLAYSCVKRSAMIYRREGMIVRASRLEAACDCIYAWIPEERRW